MPTELTDEQILEKFKSNKQFDEHFQEHWKDKAQHFCKLARVVHDAGLDWYFATFENKFQIRFGRKEPSAGRAKGMYGLIESTHEMNIDIGRVPDYFNINRKIRPVTHDNVDDLQKDLEKNQEAMERWLGHPQGEAHWPDSYGEADMPQEQGVQPEESGEEKNTLGAPLNRIYYGPPGTGKTYTLGEIIRDSGYNDHRMVTFHQSYGYEEFVEGLRPKLGVGNEANQVGYEIRDGVFKELCKLARANPENRYLMLIDEINRGNISKILGELITLIEVDKREGQRNAVKVNLPYSFEEFSVPTNVDIIGTMNTADRSLALLDTALRRRFEFVPMLPDTRDEQGAPLHQLRVRVLNQEIDVRKMLETINKRIEALYDRDHCIGHAYFTELRGLTPETGWTKLQNIFKNRILPLLEEYFFEDWEKIRLVLADNSKARDFQFIIKDKSEDTAAELFGTNDDEFESLGLRSRYRVHPEAFAKPESYIGIYQPQQN